MRLFTRKEEIFRGRPKQWRGANLRKGVDRRDQNMVEPNRTLLDEQARQATEESGPTPKPSTMPEFMRGVPGLTALPNGAHVDSGVATDQDEGTWQYWVLADWPFDSRDPESGYLVAARLTRLVREAVEGQGGE